MILNEGYTFDTFDAEAALSGNPIAVKDHTGAEDVYYLVESFEKNPNPNEVSLPFRVLITLEPNSINPSTGTAVTSKTPIYMKFDRSGYNSAYDTDYTLWMANSTLDVATGGQAGPVVPGEQTGEQYTMTSLNYREQIAVQVLNAVIGHYDNPLAYTDSTIKLLVDRSFKFAIEFVTQARKFRNEDIIEGGSVIVEEPDVVGELRNTTEQLKSVVTALVGDATANPPVPGIKDTLTDLVKSIDGDTDTQKPGVVGELHSIVDSLEGDSTATPAKVGIRDGINNINTALTTGAVHTDLNNIHTDLSANGGIQAKLTTLHNDAEAINQELGGGLPPIVDAIEDLTIITSSGLDHIETNTGSTGGIQTKLDTIHTDLTSGGSETQLLTQIATNTANTAARLTTSNRSVAELIQSQAATLGDIKSNTQYSTGGGATVTSAGTLLNNINNRLYTGNRSAAELLSIINTGVVDIENHVTSIDNKTPSGS